MSESFKINIHFDEKGEELENLIKYIIINTICFYKAYRREKQCLKQ